ncbi:hypothetical protein V6N13_089006 [Hibiscus sabdariffa]|uniref:Uncharacterized protein n=1 Tax=Hibiscus sabdariffa TaxID=183260 RepID=A0ABR2G137_9ROSI
MDVAAPPRLVYCNIDPVRFSSLSSNRVSIRTRTRPVRAVVTKPKLTRKASSQLSTPPNNNINDSSKS